MECNGGAINQRPQTSDLSSPPGGVVARHQPSTLRGLHARLHQIYFKGWGREGKKVPALLDGKSGSSSRRPDERRSYP